MAQRVRYPDHIEPLVEFVEETTPDRIVRTALWPPRTTSSPPARP